MTACLINLVWQEQAIYDLTFHQHLPSHTRICTHHRCELNEKPNPCYLTISRVPIVLHFFNVCNLIGFVVQTALSSKWIIVRQRHERGNTADNLWNRTKQTLMHTFWFFNFHLSVFYVLFSILRLWIQGLYQTKTETCKCLWLACTFLWYYMFDCLKKTKKKNRKTVGWWHILTQYIGLLSQHWWNFWNISPDQQPAGGFY